MLYFLVSFGNICSLIRYFYIIVHISMLRKKISKCTIWWIRPLDPACFMIGDPHGNRLRSTACFAKPDYLCYSFIFVVGGKLSGGWTKRQVPLSCRDKHLEGWTFRGLKFPGVKRPGVKPQDGELSRRWIVRGAEQFFYKGMNHPGVNHERGETTGTQINYISILLLL